LGPAPRAIVVTVDGLRPDLITPENAPYLSRLIDEGAATRHAQTVSPSRTLPAHASLISGVTPAEHGITWNTWQPHRPRLETPTIFDAAERSGLSTALFAGKNKFKQLIVPGRFDHIYVAEDGDVGVMSRARLYLSNELPDLMMVHLPDVDRAGHAHGWASEQQLEAIRLADQVIGELCYTLEEEGFVDDTVLIVTADHGGHGHGHRHGVEVDSSIPWIAWGYGVAPGELAPCRITDTAHTLRDVLNL
jgi:predicted AlkP superfamily pyrophosphatase or phosphodiesterase